MFEVTILVVLPELTLSEYEALLSLVSPEKRKRIQKFHFMKDAQNCLLSDILTRIEICRLTGLNNKQLKFSTNEYGKPFLATDRHIHFNISHSGHYIACAISDEPVGIDIEIIKHIDMKIAERFFAPNEIAYIMESDSTHRFYDIWTKKESRIKWEGVGLHKQLSSFCVMDSKNEEEVLYQKVFYNNEAISHVCSKKKEVPSVLILNTNILLELIK